MGKKNGKRVDLSIDEAREDYQEVMENRIHLFDLQKGKRRIAVTRIYQLADKFCEQLIPHLKESKEEAALSEVRLMVGNLRILADGLRRGTESELPRSSVN